ncbi:MAG: hypothetical protein OXH57_00355 [Ekhidna sp.]|nr:hypothetical protein [Ekhidna sp.]
MRDNRQQMNALAFLVEYQEITGGRTHSLGLFIQNRDGLYEEYNNNVFCNGLSFFKKRIKIKQ